MEESEGRVRIEDVDGDARVKVETLKKFPGVNLIKHSTTVAFNWNQCHNTFYACSFYDPTNVRLKVAF